MIPAKMTSEPPDLQNYLQAPQNWSPSLSDVTNPPAILSPRREGRPSGHEPRGKVSETLQKQSPNPVENLRPL